MIRFVVPAMLLTWSPTVTAVAQAVKPPGTLEVAITAGAKDLYQAPIVIPLSVRKGAVPFTTARLDGDGLKLAGQLTAPGLATEGIASSNPAFIRRDLHFVLPALKAGQTVRLLGMPGAVPPPSHPSFFAWEKSTPEHTDLQWMERRDTIGRPVLRYMHVPYDPSTPAKRDRSYKPFHHLYTPAGDRVVTNGGHLNNNVGDPKKLLYPHHRGLQMGWNKCSWDGGNKKADTWHCQKNDYQSHEGILSAEAGPVLGRHRVAINWHGANEVFAKEEREMTVYRLPGGTLVEFAARVKTTGGPAKLDGDPQHAGFQFRAHNDVAEKTSKQTYYLRPDGKGKPGETRNWEPKTKKGPINLLWDAMCFVLDGQRYTVCYLNHPKNPGESRWSERDYGRFGCYFEYELTPENPLVVNYRIWLQDGEMTGEQVQALSEAFVAPPKVAVK